MGLYIALLGLFMDFCLFSHQIGQLTLKLSYFMILLLLKYLKILDIFGDLYFILIGHRCGFFAKKVTDTTRFHLTTWCLQSRQLIVGIVEVSVNEFNISLCGWVNLSSEVQSLQALLTNLKLGILERFADQIAQIYVI